LRCQTGRQTLNVSSAAGEQQNADFAGPETAVSLAQGFPQFSYRDVAWCSLYQALFASRQYVLLLFFFAMHELSHQSQQCRAKTQRCTEYADHKEGSGFFARGIEAEEITVMPYSPSNEAKQSQ
jgi:hypothetical protein